MKKLLFVLAVSGLLIGCAEQGDQTSPPLTPSATNEPATNETTTPDEAETP